TDTDAKVAVSDAAFGFLDNAETVYAESGANATLSVDVLGGKQYCWKYSTNGSTWTDLNDADIIGASSRTVTIPMNDARFGYKYKCTVTGLSGNTEDSSAVNIRRKLMITKQPEDIRGAMGSTYNTGLTAFGDGLKYTWYMLDDDSGNRISITYKGYQTSTLSIKLDASTAYRSFVCVVKDKYGNELTSDKMTIRENITVSVTPKKLTLVSRPGSTAVLTVNQTGRFYPDDSFVWHSSAESVATVENGTVTAKDGLTEPGTATITVSTSDGKYSDSCIVTVNPIPAAEMPKASLASGRYPYGSKVTLTSATANAKIIYTTDGSDPEVDAAGSPLGTTVLYSSPITLTADISLKAATVKDGYKNSRTSTYNYTVEAGWGDVNGLIRNKFTAPEDVPDGIWFIFGNENDGYSDVYTKSADTDFSKTYTGSAITFDTEIHVFHGNGRLWQNRDYTLTYSANTSVPTAAAKPRVTVTGKGNYTGKSIFSFRIGPADLSDADITSEKSIGAAAGSKLGAIKPSVSFNGKKLSANKDYVLEYYRDSVATANLIADPAKETLESGRTYYIKMNAKGGSCFTGTAATATVRAINEKDNVSVAMSKVKITVPKVPYSPAGIKVQKLFDGSWAVKASVTYKNTPLNYGTDFTIDDVTLTDSGKYTIALHGTADTGNPYSFYGNKTATVEVTGIPASKVKIACMATSCDYRRRRIVLNDFYKADNTGYTEVTLYTKDGAAMTALSEGDDYSVSLSNSGSTGSANVVFTLKGVYNGTIKKAVRINAYNLAKDPKNLIGITVDDAAFVKSGAVPAVRVTFDGAVLKEGEDYSVAYKNNAKTGDKADRNAPAATVKGMGNFTGSVSIPFSITKSDASGIEIECADVPYKNKAGAFKSKVKITEGGTALSIGKNKDIESADISYYYADTGEELDDNVTVRADTAIEVRAKVTCSSSSPYIAGPYVIKGFYRVISADKDISRASISIDASDLKYDRGRYVLPEKKKGMVKLGTYVLEESEFEIVSVTGNRFLGTATVKIRGTGSYGGTKSATFRIGAKPMN
ncbi:MAG: chitobiase/beta-hexosaminidase C-terminal domain-containing protein, partial [Lachnospiraceae bacterium]|nr:chitobiase/beta-hexosaminidase C-terminal domain-containing protein [Lachnospiraceae bacterium]